MDCWKLINDVRILQIVVLFGGILGQDDDGVELPSGEGLLHRAVVAIVQVEIAADLFLFFLFPFGL